MNILYWGNDRDGYRQKMFIKFAGSRGHRLIFSKRHKKINNQILKNLSDIFYELGEIPSLIKSKAVYIPPIEHTAGKIFLARLFGNKVVCDIYAPIYDMTVNDEKLYSAKSIMAKRYYFRDRYSMLKSDFTLFLNEAEKEHFLQTVNLTDDRVNAVNMPLVIPEKKSAGLAYFNGENHVCRLCWTGSFIALQGVDCIIEAIDILRKEKAKVFLYIIGPSNAKKSHYEKMVEEKQLTDYVEFPEIWGSIEAWQDFIAEKCDISLGIFGDSEKAKRVVANKVVDAIAMKTPLITGKSKGVDLYFNQETDIYTCSNTPEALAKEIKRVMALSSDEIRQNIGNAYEVYLDNFSETAFEKNMDRLFERLV